MEKYPNTSVVFEACTDYGALAVQVRLLGEHVDIDYLKNWYSQTQSFNLSIEQAREELRQYFASSKEKFHINYNTLKV